ncbi:MAG: NfeD family protein [Thermoguttaceae bacterium]
MTCLLGFSEQGRAQTRGNAILLDVSLPISNKSGHAVLRALERAVQELRQQESNKTTDQTHDAAPLAATTEQEEDANLVTNTVPPTLILNFNVGTNQELFGRGSSFGACYEIAKYLESNTLKGIRTIAYFPQSVRGHVLLVALACDERIIAADSDLGEAGIDETKQTEAQKKAYQEIAGSRRTVSTAIVEKLLDSQSVLLEAETEKGRLWITPDEIDALRQTTTLAEEPKILIERGVPGIFSAEKARHLQIVQLIADDIPALARELGFRPDDIKHRSVADEMGSAIRINVNGIMTHDLVSSVIRGIETAINSDSETIIYSGQEKARIGFICFWIDSPGGNLEASLNLASYIAKNVNAKGVRTVAYIPHQARGDASLVALACDEIVLGTNAVLGGDGAVVFSEQQIKEAKRFLRDFFSKEALRSWSLPLALIDPNLEVFKMTRTGPPILTDYFCEEEWKELHDSAKWQKGEIVTKTNKPLEIVGGIGPSYLVDRTAKDFAELKMLYGLEHEPKLLEPSWSEQLVKALSSPGMSALILSIVIFAVIAESKSPGFGIGGFVALMGLVLFFWLNFLGGTAGWLEVMLFIGGVVCVLLEIFVIPGFGIFGIGGGIAMMAALVLASQTFIIPQNSYQYKQFGNSMLILVISGVGVLVLSSILIRIFHHAAKPNNIEIVRQSEKLVDYDDLLGRTGITATPLVPAGIVLIDGKPVNVVSDGNLIERETSVEVIEVSGYRIVVRKTESA